MSDDRSAVRGIEMDNSEVASFLESQGHGILALADEGAAYGLPVSFGHDGEDVYVRLIRFGEEGEKFAYADETERACLTTYEVDSRFEWRSVVARGPLEHVTGDRADHAESVVEDNSWVPSLFPPTSPMTGVERFVLEVDEATGRKGEAYQE